MCSLNSLHITMDINATRTRCSVKFCKSGSSSKNVSFFQYPTDERLEIWMKNCETEHLAEKLKNKNSYKVCGEHFEKKMFLNALTKNRLVFNAIPTKFSDEILFQRKKLKEMSAQHSETRYDAQNFYLPNCSISAPYFEDSKSLTMMPDISRPLCPVGIPIKVGTCDMSNQTPLYLSANSPRKLKLEQELKNVTRERKRLEKTIKRLSKQLSYYGTVENYLTLSKKYLSPELFTTVKLHINNK